MKYSFGAFEFDVRAAELKRRGEPLAVRPKVLELLRALIEERHRPLSKEELLERVWSDAHVGHSALSTTLGELRRALEDTGKRQSVIRTVRGRGYRFVGAVRGEGRDAMASRAADTRPVDFVGRERTLARLGETLESVGWGRGRIVMLGGEPGIGKTRTAQEFAAIARLRGARTVGGWCYEGEGAPAFWPWVQVLRAIVAPLSQETLGELLGSGLADVVALVPELRARLGRLEPRGSTSLEELRFRQFDAVARLLAHAAEEAPLVIVLDDLHLADLPSLRLLEFLAHAIAEMQVLVLGTYRATELGESQGLGPTLELLARREEYSRFVLDALAPDDAEQLVRRLTFAELPDDLLHKIVRRAGGNPFFLRELVSLVRDRASLNAVPLGVRDAIRRRLAQVPTSREVLDIAAVAGRRFELDAVARAGGIERGEALDALERATSAGLLARDEWLAYRFSHALVQETVYAELPASRRLQLHRRLGECFEERGADGASDLAELAYHFRHAAEADRAVHYSIRAGEASMRVAAPEAAIDHYMRALELIDGARDEDEEVRFDLLLRLAGAQGANEFEESRDTLLRAVEAARRLRDGERLARVAIRIADRSRIITFVDTPAEQCTKLLEEALAGVRAESVALRIELLTRLSGQLADSEQFERADGARVEAIELARKTGDRKLEASVLVDHHRARWARVSAADSLAGATQALTLADACGAHELAVLAQQLRAAALVAVGDVAEADAEVARLARRTAERGSVTAAFFIPNYRLMRCFLDARFSEAEGAIVGARRGEGQAAMSLSVAQLIQIRRAQGDPSQFEGILADLRDESSSLAHSVVEAVLCMELGRREEARAAFERAMQREFTPEPRESVWHAKAALLTEVCVYLEDRDRAERLYESLLPHAGRVLVAAWAFQCYGTADLALAQLAALLGRSSAAERHAIEALALAERMGAPVIIAMTRLVLAVIQLARGDCGRACDGAHQALAAAEALGLQPVAEQARGLLRRSGTASSQS